MHRISEQMDPRNLPTIEVSGGCTIKGGRLASLFTRILRVRGVVQMTIPAVKSALYFRYT